MQEITEYSLPHYYRDDFKRYPWRKYESNHYVFHYMPCSLVEKDIDLIKETQENNYKKTTSILKLPYNSEKISYYFYPSSEAKEQMMGGEWYAQLIYKDYSIHTLYTGEYKNTHGREDAHVLSLSWGQSTGFLQEGLAECLVGCDWSGRNHDIKAKEGLEKKILPTLTDILEHKAWANLPADKKIFFYAYAGSVVRFLIDSYNMERFRAFYMESKRENTKYDNIQEFMRTYHLTPEKFEEMWRKSLL